MKRPKLVLIEPKAPNLHIFSIFVIPRLGILLLGAIVKNMGWQVEVVVEQGQPLDWSAIADADMVGISTITSTAPRAYAIADQARQMGLSVIMGGSHVTFLPDEALAHCDFVIRGEGEKALPLFLEKWQSQQDLSVVPNLSYRYDQQIIHNPSAELIDNLDSIPYPDFSLIHNGIKSTFGYKVVPVQTSRGCPFDCEFCSVTGMFGRQIRFRSTANIIQELRQYNHPRNFVFFYDDNFTANRKRTKELLQAMIAEKFRFRWSTQVRADVGNDSELVELMSKAGCQTVFIGFESIDAENLLAIDKRQSVADIETAIALLLHHRIQIHGMFIFGLDNDTPERLAATADFARRKNLSTAQFLILTPFPGTATYRKLAGEGRIKSTDWGLYDAHHPVYQPRKLTMRQLQHAQILAHDSFYSRRQSLKWLTKLAWDELLISIYARNLNKKWCRQNQSWLSDLGRD